MMYSLIIVSIIALVLFGIAFGFVPSGYCRLKARGADYVSLSMTSEFIDMFGADSMKIRLEKMKQNSSAPTDVQEVVDYMKLAEEKASKSIVDSITGNRTMKAEALRLEAELDQLNLNEDKLAKNIERLEEIDASIKKLIKGEITLSELISSSEYKFDEEYILRIAELTTMARLEEEKELLVGFMETILKSEKCAQITKRLLERVSKK